MLTSAALHAHRQLSSAEKVCVRLYGYNNRHFCFSPANIFKLIIQLSKQVLIIITDFSNFFGDYRRMNFLPPFFLVQGCHCPECVLLYTKEVRANIFKTALTNMVIDVVTVTSAYAAWKIVFQWWYVSSFCDLALCVLVTMTTPRYA